MGSEGETTPGDRTVRCPAAELHEAFHDAEREGCEILAARFLGPEVELRIADVRSTGDDP